MKKKNMNKKNDIKNLGVFLLSTLVAGSFSAAADNAIEAKVERKLPIVSQDRQQDRQLKDLVVRSELIFQGRLVDISERLSIEKIPYTFVTYAINEVIGGRYTNNTITLKYVGGQFANGNRLTASNSPNVKLGEQAILMVQQSTDTGCDFVDCEKGRFVIENDKIIAANQSVMALDKKGGVDFVSRLKGLHKTASLQRKSPRPEFVDLDKRAPFKAYPALTQAQKAPAVPQQAADKKPHQVKGSQFDQWEVEQLRLNGGDPLLNSNNNNNK